MEQRDQFLTLSLPRSSVLMAAGPLGSARSERRPPGAAAARWAYRKSVATHAAIARRSMAHTRNKNEQGPAGRERVRARDGGISLGKRSGGLASKDEMGCGKANKRTRCSPWQSNWPPAPGGGGLAAASGHLHFPNRASNLSRVWNVDAHLWLKWSWWWHLPWLCNPRSAAETLTLTGYPSSDQGRAAKNRS